MKGLWMLVLLTGTLSGCAKGGDSAATDATSLRPVPAEEAAYGNNTCVVTKPGGALAEGAEAVGVYLLRDYLSSVTQKIYGEGAFPDHYPLVPQDDRDALPKSTILSHSSAWSWSIGPARDADGRWTLLQVFKEALYAVNGKSYVIASEIFQYGDKIEIHDPDSDIQIKCSIPKH